jgi:methionyl-tRNA formyltransferase
MSRPFRIAYFGLPLGACLLHGDGHELALAVLSPVEAPGRRRIQRLLGNAVLDALDDEPHLDAAIDERLTEARADLLVSWFWTRRLPGQWLALPRLGGIGAHPSLLPRHRGPNPYFGAIDAGDAETGMSIHRLTAAYDEGSVLLRERLPVGELNAWQLARALDRPALRLLRLAVLQHARGVPFSEEPQDEALATWAPEPEGEALRADFHWPAARVLRRLRALSPVPGLALSVRGIEFFATRARLCDDYPRALLPGEAAVVDDGTLVIRCADAAIAIERAVASDEGSDRVSELDERTLGRLVSSVPATHAGC